MTACNCFNPQPVLWLILALLSQFVGCARHTGPCDLPTQSLLPFSESGEALIPDRWWTEFDDPNLDLQVELALGGNFDLAAALHRLQAARAVTRREASDFFIDLDGFVTTDTTFGPGPDRTRSNWGFDAAYQVDLWGRIQSRVDAERFRAQATASDYQSVALSIAAEVARTWFALVESHAQVELLDEQLQTNRDGLQAQEARFRSGGEQSAPDVLRQRQLVQSTLEQIVVAQSRIEVLEHQLAVLTGQQPQLATYETGARLPRLPPAPETGLPSELLMRRPDVRANYLAFVAADRDLAAAITDQYPRLNITGSLVSSATGSDNLLRDWFLSIGSQLVGPILDGGQRRAEIDRTSSVKRQRYNEFGQSMLVAFQEVEDALALERYQIQRIERLQAQVELADKSAELLREGYIFGTASFLDFLSATQSKQRLQREILSSRLDLVLIRIGLYLAIAGDFDTRPQMAVESIMLGDEGEVSVMSDQAVPALVPPELPSPMIQRLPPEPALPVDE